MEPDNHGNNAEAPSGAGPFVGAAIIILLLAFGAYYFWSSKSGMVNENPPPLILGNDPAEDVSSDAAAGLPPQGNSDSPEAIESDLQVIDLNQFDAQIDVSLDEFEQNAQ
ncbi:MAG TPA: hypothetical protein VJ043_01120 [Candidatus Paceibacterota bacterium]|uniref:Uncharacterized protein n=1 Tax=Candidatus Liptonbacteria bacterium RIFCSPLOWO2_01_FULL_45_15 TaxID=1798649 RepID=A0A1G2CFN0_9BACT|nr:MAG: hypothetical protein A3B13_02255 [Candidatus Liptonbacteria bacterium RIFCSPLOWO2_01_FULL_45_15]HXK38674.1 hypothetical protein [Candidatus Paceibacterota bacterium]